MKKIDDLPRLIQYLSHLTVDGRCATLAVDDAHATEKLKPATGRQLIISYPGIRLSGEYLGNCSKFVTIHVLERNLGAERTEEREREQYMAMYTTVVDIISKIQHDIQGRSGACTLISGSSVALSNINPTYNIYGGWGGWMIEIEL